MLCYGTAYYGCMEHILNGTFNSMVWYGSYDIYIYIYNIKHFRVFIGLLVSIETLVGSLGEREIVVGM